MHRLLPLSPSCPLAGLLPSTICGNRGACHFLGEVVEEEDEAKGEGRRLRILLDREEGVR
jgi:hypothetical protein